MAEFKGVDFGSGRLAIRGAVRSALRLSDVTMPRLLTPECRSSKTLNAIPRIDRVQERSRHNHTQSRLALEEEANTRMLGRIRGVIDIASLNLCRTA